MLTPKRLAAALRDSPPKTTASTTRLRRSSESAIPAASFPRQESSIRIHPIRESPSRFSPFGYRSSPHHELLVMIGQRLQMLRPLLSRGQVAMRSPGKRPEEMVFRQLKLRWSRPHKRRNFRHSRDCRCVVVGVDAGLQLANPIPACANRQLGIVQETFLEAAFVEPRVIERSEVGSPSAEHADKL